MAEHPRRGFPAVANVSDGTDYAISTVRIIEVPIEENRSGDPLALTRLTTERGTVCLAASGEIDLCNANRLRATIESIVTEPTTRRLTLDFAGLDYIDSMGVSALIVGLRLSQRNGTEFGVVNPRGEVLRVLQILGLDRTLAPSA
jgi:anti-anti-sigma factor